MSIMLNTWIMWGNFENTSKLEKTDKYNELREIIEEMLIRIENNNLSHDDLKSYWGKITQYRDVLPNLVHDLNNELLILKSLILEGKDLTAAKKSLEKLFLWQLDYDINEVYNLAIEKAKALGLELEFLINNWGSVYEIIIDKAWKVVSKYDGAYSIKKTSQSKFSLVRLFKKVAKIKSNAEDIYITKRFDVNNIPVARIFSNTFKNAKEAGATKIKVVVTYGPLTKMDILKIIDNWKGMTKNVIENVLFKKGVSTKWTQWIWMYWLAKDFLKFWWDIEVHSLLENWEYFEAHYSDLSLKNKDNIVPLDIKQYLTDYQTDKIDKFFNQPGTQFVFKYSQVYNEKRKAK